MLTIGYLYSKFFKKILRGKSILRSKIDKTSLVYSGSQLYDSSLGRYSYVGYDCDIMKCNIGAFCSIANNVVIGGARHPLDWVSTSPVFYNVKGGTGYHLATLKEPETKITNIGNDVWIGNRAIIMQGLTIGTGAVVGAGAVVTKDVPPYAIVAGVPATIMRYRFDENTIEDLLASKWWEATDVELKELGDLIPTPELFLTQLSKLSQNEKG